MLPSLEELPAGTASRLDRRRSLLEQFDDKLRRIDHSRAADSLSEFQQQVFRLLSSPRTRDAFYLSKESSETQPHYCLGAPQADFLEKSQFPIRLDSFGETVWSSRKRMCRCRRELCHRGCHTKPLFRSLLFEPLLLGNSFGILLCPVRSRKPAQTAVPRIRFENVASVR